MIWWKIKKIMLKQLRKVERGFRILSEDNIKEYDARQTRGKKEKSLY